MTVFMAIHIQYHMSACTCIWLYGFYMTCWCQYSPIVWHMVASHILTSTTSVWMVHMDSVGSDYTGVGVDK